MSKFEYIPRVISNQITELLGYFPSIVVVGARQVGKSTLLKHLFPTYSYVLFDPYEDVENARADPDLFLNNRSTPIILDEVQYAPEVISAIKRRIDRNKEPGQYILTGSQQWGVMKQMAESLTGRTVIIQLESFALAEIASGQADHSWLREWLTFPQKQTSVMVDNFYLPRPTYEQLWRGFLPDAQTLPLSYVQTFQSSYQKTYIERDIRLLADLSDLHQFTRFVRIVAALTSQEVNFQQIGRDLGVANLTAKRWLSLLKEIFEWHEIQPFSLNAIKRVSSKPKGYFADTGQICYCQAITSPQALGASPLWGAIFETAVINELRKQLLWMAQPFNLFHWRAHSGAEVDLIIEQNGTYYPIEVKAKTRPTTSDTSGIKAFRKTYPTLSIAKGLVICLTENSYQLSDNDYAFPWNAKSFV